MPEAAVEPLDDPSAIGAFITDLVPSGRDDSFVSTPPVRVEARLLAVDSRDFPPQPACAAPRAVTDVESDHLSGLCVDGNPDPLLVGLAAHETPQFIGFRFQA